MGILLESMMIWQSWPVKFDIWYLFIYFPLSNNKQ